MKPRTLSTKLNLIYIAIYGAMACIYPFFISYFQAKGLTYTQMGIAFAVISITGVIAQPIWGFITDKYSNKRKIIIITICLSSLAVYSLVFVSSFYFILGSIVLLMIFQSPVAPIVDAYSYEIIEQHKKMQYGKIRLMGSFGYAIVALFLGYVIKQFGINSSFFVYSVVMVLGVVVLYSIDYKDKSIRQPISASDVVSLIRDNRFLLLMVSVVFTNIAIGSNGNYISILLEKTGGDVTQLGIVWFIVAISELPVFFFGVRLLKKYGELNLYILGVVIFGLRYFLDSICDSYIPVLIIQLMQGVTYTFYLIASLQYLDHITPARMRTSAITLHAASIGIGGVIGNMGGGMLLEYISIFMFYKVLTLTCVACVLVLVALKSADAAQDEKISIAG